jgi:glycerophosphoryl diester phosphodiesterase
MNTTVNIWQAVLPGLRKTWRQIFQVHMVFTVLGFVLFSPLITGFGRLLVLVSGQPALDDQDIVYFFLSPPGMLAMILVLGLLAAVIALEQAAMMRVAVGVKHGQSASLIEVMAFTLARARRLIDFSLRLVSRIFLLTAPFLAVAYGIALLLITDYDINYYLNQKPAEFWWAVILISIVLIAMVALLVRKLLQWSLALPFVLFADELSGKSFSLSRDATNKRLATIFATMATWTVLTILLGLIPLGVIGLIGTWIVPMAHDSISVLVVVLGGLSLVWMVGNFITTALTSGSFAYLLIEFFESYGPGSPEPARQARRSEVRFGGLHLGVKNLAIGLVTAAIAAGIVGVWLLEGIRSDDDVTIVAHRGAAGKAPENTIAAFQQAIEDNTDWIELDVQETVDGKVVVFHDSDFMKLVGNEARVWETSMAEIRDIDIGSWFDPVFSEQRAPTLQEVLELARGRVNVVIELKYYGHDQKLEKRVVDIVEATDMVGSTAIMSLKYDALLKIRKLRPDWHTGLLSAKAIGDTANLDIDFMAVEKGMARGGFIRRMHQAGKKVFVWTVNDPVSMSRLMSLGVDGIITDEPELARKVLDQRRDLNIAERLLIHTAVIFGQPYTPKQYRDDSP